MQQLTIGLPARDFYERGTPEEFYLQNNRQENDSLEARLRNR